MRRRSGALVRDRGSSSPYQAAPLGLGESRSSPVWIAEDSMAQQQVQYRKPIPIPSLETEFFWDKVRQHELWIQRCKDCLHVYFYTRPFCPKCLSMNVEGFQTAGKGFLSHSMNNP